MICEVCFTNSWQPCPEGTPDAVTDKKGGYMVCGYCRLVDTISRLRDAAIPALEWFEQVYPPGAEGDLGAIRAGKIREGLRKALANIGED